MNHLVTRKEVMQLIPKHCLEKSTFISMYYLIRDLSLLSTAFWTYEYLPLLVFWNIYGLLMWNSFVIGHDCCHGAFSEHTWINDVCGHLTNTILCVPFWPLRYSHGLHHQYHNHVNKDTGHLWIDHTQSYYLENIIFGGKWLVRFISPFGAFFSHIVFGVANGSHLVPWSFLFKRASRKEKYKCMTSSFIVFIFVYVMLFRVFRGDFIKFATYYGGCYIVFSWWLFMVTYLTHHDEYNIAWNDSNWSWMKGALRTVDRRIGFGLDDFTHHIHECHVAHHFCNKIPHYHLKEATDAIKPFLIKQGHYRFVQHALFPSFVFDWWAIWLQHAWYAKIY